MIARGCTPGTVATVIHGSVMARVDLDLGGPYSICQRRGRLRMSHVTPTLAVEPCKPLDLTTRAARPFVRWVGGKTRLLDAIVPFVPETFRNYHEPFLGSGAVFFAVRERATGVCLLSDLNSELVNAWNVVRARPNDLLKSLSQFDGRSTEEDYYCIRSASPKGAVDRAARFFYLNQTSWNALWRENRWGVFNVPWGRRNFRGFSADELGIAARSLAGVGIVEQDFRAALSKAGPGDFVYLDPPYLPVSDTSKFAGYTEKRFRAADLKELAELCEGLSEAGVNWVLSNRDTPLVRDLFAHARIVRFTTRRSVAAQNRRNVEPADSPEVVIVGGPDAHR